MSIDLTGAFPDEAPCGIDSDARRRVVLRQLIDAEPPLVVPGAANALTARLVEDAGFQAVYITGAGVANTYLGMPDIGILTLTQMAEHLTAIHAVVPTPLIVDADTGFGNAVNTFHTVQTLERAGAAAIQIEDQDFPKRCGHFTGKTVIDAEEMAEKIRAATDARTDPNLLIIGRTDARAEHGLTEAIRRGQRYHDAGADIVFVEAPQTLTEIETIAHEVPGPKVLNLVQGGKTPDLPLDHITELGYAMVLHANLALLATIHSVSAVLTSLHNHGTTDLPPHATWTQRQQLVRTPFYDALANHYRGS